MNKELRVSIQNGSWMNDFYGGEANALLGFTVAKEAGFEALDFNINDRYPGKFINAKEKSAFFSQDIETILKSFASVKEAIEKTGVVLDQAHASFPLYIDNCEEMNDHLIMVVDKMCAVCQYLGCPAIVVHPWSSFDKEKEREVNLNMYRRMIPSGKKYGVKLCLENMFMSKSGTGYVGGACAEAEEAAWYIDTLNAEAGFDCFGYCFDLGHANLCKRNIRDELNIIGHRLTCLHLHDNNSTIDQHFAPMTQRKTDWDGLIAGLRDINYRGTLSFETFVSMQKYPKELVPAMLKYTARVGQYLRDKILEEEVK